MPEVSVIVPNYNHAQFLSQRMDSILEQSYTNFEVIILDDASTDTSKDLIENYREHPKVSRIIRNKENSGSPFKQWKQGWKQASGNFIWIAESDDYCSTNLISRCLEKFIESPEVGIVYTQSVDTDPEGRKVGNRLSYTEEFVPNIWEQDFVLDGEDFIRSYLSHKNVLPNASAVMFRKSLIPSEAIFEEIQHMRMCGDWYFWLRLVRDTKISFIAEPLNNFRQHPQMSRRQVSTEAKKQRLAEEAQVRRYLVENLGLDQDAHYKNIRDKWFRLSHKWSIFKKDFYRVKHPSISRMMFGIQCWMYKLKNRLN